MPHSAYMPATTEKPLRLMRSTLYTHAGRVVRTVTLSDDKLTATVRHHGENPYLVNTAELGRANADQCAVYLTKP